MSALVFLGTILVSTLVGLPLLAVAVMILDGVVKERRYRHLSRFGRRVEARIQGVREGTIGSEDPIPYWRLVWRWQDPQTRKLYFFQSGKLDADPTPFVNEHRSTTVLVDPRNPNRYAIDDPGLETLEGRLSALAEVEEETERARRKARRRR